MKHYASILLIIFIILAPHISRAAEIKNLLDNLVVELETPPRNLTVQFKDIDMIGSEEKWCYRVVVKNGENERKTFSAEIAIYHQDGYILDTPIILHIDGIEPDAEVEIIDVILWQYS